MRRLLLLLFCCSAIAASPGFHNQYDYEVRDWAKNRVVAQGSTIADSTYAKTTVFMLRLKAWGLRPKIRRLNTFVGSSLAAINAPLIIDDVTTADNPLNFVSGDYSESGGLAGNGINKVITTGYSPQAPVTVDNSHLAVFSLTASDETNGHGCNNNGSTASFFLRNRGLAGNSQAVLGYFTSANSYVSTADSSGKGLYLATRPSSANVKLYVDGVIFGTSVSTEGNLPGLQLQIYALNNNGVTVNYSSKTYCGYSAGQGMSATDAANYYTAWRLYRLSLGTTL